MAIPIKSTALGFLEKSASVPAIHQRPRSTVHASFADALWIVFSAYKLKHQDVQNKGGEKQTEVADKSSDTFKFLAPNEIAENIGHDYEEYSSLASRVGDKIAHSAHTGAEAGGVLGALTSAYKNLQTKEGRANLLGSVTSQVGGVQVHYNKFDAALVYKNTPRREYQFQFNLIDEGNPRQDIMDLIKRLQRYSVPGTDIESSSVHINPPYVFDLKTEPGSMLLVPRCVLTAIQPTYRGPYRDGYPTLCELTLSFKDLDPLYSDSKGIAATEILSISSTLKKHIPGIDKAKKLTSVLDRGAESASGYDFKYDEETQQDKISTARKIIGKV